LIAAQQMFVVYGVWLAIGVAVGMLCAAVVARTYVDRQIRRVRAAERRARSAKRMAELGAMTGGLAHEIKNPLSTIALNAQLLGESIEELDVDESERGRLVRRAASLEREVERLRGILTDFLDYAGEIKLHRTPTDLNKIVDELVDFFLPQAERHGVRLRAHLAQSPVVASIDVGHVKQAVLNLLLNAVQAMAATYADERSGDLIIRIEQVSDDEQGEFAVIHVTDTGPGMDQAMVARIFEPYFTSKSGGSGLGLPTARRLIEQHEGRIEVHSEVGQGTDFALFLPLSGAKEPAK
jgi:signal transduction histidine kinase